LGIRYVGETVAKTLVAHFKSMEALQHANSEELTSVNEIGERIGMSLQQYFGDEKNRLLIAKLQSAGIQMKAEEEKPKGTSLLGKSLIISGTFSRYSRDEIKALIEQHGGKNVSSISTKTDYLVAGENVGPSKLEKVRELNIPVINEEEFLQMIGEIK
jgi:DNA ligase (NAD+)